MTSPRPDATECIERIRSGVSASEFGYKVQALAAHVLLRLGYRIDAINRAGHPDIVATKNGWEARFEIEAEAFGPSPRKLTDADFASLTEGQGKTGYYALAITSPMPYWVLVPASSLVERSQPWSNLLLEALSDKERSAGWTREYQKLLEERCSQIRLATFGYLRRAALKGLGL